jgi:CCR4-NOT transcription complex subunit 4
MNSGTATTSTRSRRGGTPRQPRNAGSSAIQDSRFSQTKAHAERKHNLVSVSRPSTPVIEPFTAPHDDLKGLRPKELLASVQPPTSPTLSPTASDRSGFQERTSSTHTRPDSVESTSSSLHLTSSVSASTSLMVPPGLSAPPGISSLSRPPRAETASPQTPLLASQSSYQMSMAARALLDDVKARRESSLPVSSGFSPFPDFDRTLQTLTDEGGGGFSFNLDPKLADEAEVSEPLPDFDLASTVPFHGSYIEAFPALRSGFGFIHPSSGYIHNTNYPIYDPATSRSGSGHSFEEQSVGGTGYTGLFNPFSEPGAESVSTSSLSRLPYPPGDEERKVSRFGFAQGRKASTVALHPLLSNPLSHSSQHQSFYNPRDAHHDARYQWSTDYHEHHVSNSHAIPAQVQHAQAQTMFTHAQNRLPSGRELSEAQLRSFIQSSQARLNDSGNLGGINGIFTSNLSVQYFL